MTKISTKDWRNLPIEKWNVTTFHAYLIDRNKEEYGVEYLPFGQGPVSRRWSQEKGQIKQAITKYGNEVVRYYIDKCFVKHKFNPRFPVLSFGFMYSYMRNELAQAQVEVQSKADIPNVDEVEGEEQTDSVREIDEDWF